MKVGIFGGCFNPPHKAHKDIALKLLKNSYLDKVIYVPTGNKYNKKDLASDLDRYNMLKLICNKNNSLEVSDYEFNNTLTYTYQTLDYFKTIYPSDEIYFICGIDNLKQLNTWKNYKYILSHYKIIVINRNKEDFDKVIEHYKQYVSNIIVSNIESSRISSTMIRKHIQNNNYNLSNILDEDVIKYIKKNNLYL